MNETQATPDSSNRTASSPLDPPACVSGLKALDRAKFEKTIRVTRLTAQSKDLKSLLKLLKPCLLKKPNFHPIVKLGK